MKSQFKVNTKRKASVSNYRNRKRECTSDMKRSARSYSEDDKILSHRKKDKSKRRKMKCSKRLSTKEAKTTTKDTSVDSNALKDLKDFNEFQEYCTMSKEDGVTAVSSFLQYKEYNMMKTIAINQQENIASSVVPASAPHPVDSRRFHRHGSNQHTSSPHTVDSRRFQRAGSNQPASSPHPVDSRRFIRPGSNQPLSAPLPVDNRDFHHNDRNQSHNERYKNRYDDNESNRRSENVPRAFHNNKNNRRHNPSHDNTYHNRRYDSNR